MRILNKDIRLKQRFMILFVLFTIIPVGLVTFYAVSNTSSMIHLAENTVEQEKIDYFETLAYQMAINVEKGDSQLDV